MLGEVDRGRSAFWAWSGGRRRHGRWKWWLTAKENELEYVKWDECARGWRHEWETWL